MNKDSITVERSSGAQQEVLGYLTGNSDRPVALSEMSRALNRASQTCSSAVRRLQEKFPLQLEINSRGIYTWHSQQMPSPKARAGGSRTDFMLEVIEQKDGKWLTKDVVTGKFYLVKELDW